ncbi:MAG: YicC family protein [Acetobacteraceae bacterium]|nr:YicC family protein [Acetobacteraceae bacterium]
MTLASMTGFAHSEGHKDGVAWHWELRSVNGRGLELRFRLPSGFDPLEIALKEAGAKLLKRGNVTANLNIKRDEVSRMAPDVAVLDQMLALATALAARIPGSAPPRAEALLALPGVLRANQAEPEALSPALLAEVRAGFDAALRGLADARLAEGARLGVIMRTQIDEVTALTAMAALDAADQPAAQQSRMMATVAGLLAEQPALPAERIAQEVAILAAKSDVREELDRLSAHLGAAHALLAEGENIGRRFEFLLQEFNREVNTLCSKSASVALTATGLKLKATLEQLREQVANVE